MECITINLIIEPILDPQIPSNLVIFREPLKMTVTINPNTLVKDICHELLKKIGIGHLAYTSEAFIKCPSISCFTSIYCFPNPMVTIGSLESWNREYLTVKICVRGKVEDFSGLEGRSTVYRNLLFFILKKYPFIQNDENNNFIKDVISSINDSSILSVQHPNLYCMNEAIEKEMYILNRNEQRVYVPPSPNLIDDYNFESSPTTPSRESVIEPSLQPEVTSPQSVQSLTTPGFVVGYKDVPDPVQPSDEDHPSDSGSDEEGAPILPPNILRRNTPSGRPRIKFNPETETPILEKWFETTRIPTAVQLQDFADHLNDISKRPEEIKVTLHNVRNWFSYRRVKEKRTSN